MSLPRLLSALTGSQLIMLVIWLGLAGFTVGLIVLLWTRWGQYRPLSKCLILSLLGHLVLGLYATTVKVTLPAEGHDELIARVSLEDGDGGGPISPEQSADDPPYHAPAAEAGSPGDSSDAELPRLGDTHDPAPPTAGPPPHPPTRLP